MISKQQRFRLFVTVSVLLGVWMDVANGMSRIQLIPQHPVIQGSVTLSITGITGKVTYYAWYRGSKTDSTHILSYFPDDKNNPLIKGPLYNSRMTAYRNGALQISNLNITDEGNYTVRIQTQKPEDVSVYLNIYEMVGKPTITTSTPKPKENGTIQLTCNSANAESIIWSRVSSGTNLPSGITLSPDNKTIILSRINRSDSGDYGCEGINPVDSKKSDPFKIIVAYGPENVKIEARLRSNSLLVLECSADSVPPATYQWSLNEKLKNSTKNLIEVDQKKMENEGTYTCVANNSVTLLTAMASVYVNATIEFQEVPKTNVGLIVGIVLAVILVLVLLAAVLYLFAIHRRQKTDNKSSTINGQSNFSPQTQEKPDLQYASVVFNKNMPKRQPAPPDTLYANRAALERPTETVYSDIRLK